MVNSNSEASTFPLHTAAIVVRYEVQGKACVCFANVEVDVLFSANGHGSVGQLTWPTAERLWHITNPSVESKVGLARFILHKKDVAVGVNYLWLGRCGLLKFLYAISRNPQIDVVVDSVCEVCKLRAAAVVVFPVPPF